MKAEVFHLQINVSNPFSLPFYKELLQYFEYKMIDEGDEQIGMSNGTVDFWIVKTEEKHQNKKFHRKGPGLNHIAFKVKKREEVGRFHKELLEKKEIKSLYNAPRAFQDYAKNYDAFFFEDPERIKIEVVFK